MSRTKRGDKRPGYEYWGKRPMSGFSPSKDVKQMTHQTERARAKEEELRDRRKAEKEGSGNS